MNISNNTDQTDSGPIAVMAGGNDDGMAFSLGFGASSGRSMEEQEQLGSAAAAAALALQRPPPETRIATAVSSSTGLLRGASSRIALLSSSGSSKRRRREHMAVAVFYGECHREGITPTQAERAANDMKGRYRKWWVDAMATKNNTCSSIGIGQKRPREEQLDTASQIIDRVSRRQEEQGGGYLYLRPQPPPATTEIGKGNEKTDSNNENEGGDNMNMNMNTNIDIDIDTDTNNSISFAIDGAQVQFSLAPSPDECTATRDRDGAKSKLLSTMADNGGDVASFQVREALQVLKTYYQGSGSDARSKRSVLSGTWLSLSRPAFSGCLGTNLHQHYLYTLGRMSFEMFRPTNLRCSIRANFSSIQIVEGSQGVPQHVPRRLRAEVLRCRNNMASSTLRRYDIIVAFVIEPNQTITGEQVPQNDKDASSGSDNTGDVITRPIRGIMKTLGYMLPDPKIPNRLSIWFTEGTLEFNDEAGGADSLNHWKRIFSGPPDRGLYGRANILAARLLLGAAVPDTMDENGTMSYEFRRPIGGHGLAFCDVVYLDEDLRILQGHGGQIYVCARLADNDNNTQPDEVDELEE